jgi:CcmD family protein
MIYLAAAYGAIWLMLFIFVFSIFRRQSKIDNEIAALEDALERISPEDKA